MVLRILFLCRGNVTRSPFMAGYLHHLYRNSEITDKIMLEVDSSGVEGKYNIPVHPRVLEKGFELGFDMAMYRSKHASLRLLKNADIIIIFDSQQLKRFKNSYPQLLDRVHHALEFGREEKVEEINIDDPSHKNTDEVFERFFSIIIPETERMWEYIKSIYYEAVKEGKEFGPELFNKKEKSINHKELRNYNFFTKRTFPLCPHCQSKKIRRIKRKGFLQRRILPIFNGYPYRCGNCNRDIILFIGSEIRSKKRSKTKQEKWQRFIELEHEAKLKNNENPGV